MIAFALIVAALTALLFGLVPAWQSTRPALTSTLKDEAGSLVGGTGHARFRKGLVVAQVGLSVLLLAGAALFARSLYNLKTLNPGFQADQLLGFSIDPSLSGHSRERSGRLISSNGRGRSGRNWRRHSTVVVPAQTCPARAGSPNLRRRARCTRVAGVRGTQTVKALAGLRILIGLASWTAPRLAGRISRASASS